MAVFYILEILWKFSLLPIVGKMHGSSINTTYFPTFSFPIFIENVATELYKSSRHQITIKHGVVTQRNLSTAFSDSTEPFKNLPK